MVQLFNEIKNGNAEDNVEKFNPYHGADGRFTSASGAASFTYKPGSSKAHDNAIENEKKRTGGTAVPSSGFGRREKRKNNWKHGRNQSKDQRDWNHEDYSRDGGDEVSLPNGSDAGKRKAPAGRTYKPTAYQKPKQDEATKQKYVLDGSIPKKPSKSSQKAIDRAFNQGPAKPAQWHSSTQEGNRRHSYYSWLDGET